MHMIYTHIHRKKLHRFYSKYIYISINTYIFTLPLFTLHLITPPLSPLFFFSKRGVAFTILKGLLYYCNEAEAWRSG